MSGGGDSKKTKSGGSSKTGILRSLSFQFTTFRGNSASKDANGSAVRDSIAESCPTLQRQESLGPIAGVQCHGLMLKKHKRKNRGAKWNKRFFVLKESFLLYYAPRYQKVFGKTKIIDLHPKGLVPLGGCSVVSGGDIGKKHCLLITHEEFKTPIILCAADFKTQEKWLLALREATKVTYKNTIMGDAMIKDLETKGLRLHQEKQTFVDQLQQETNALREEIDKNEMLEKVKTELELEKVKLIRMTKKLKADLQIVKQDLQMTTETKKTLEQEKMNLNSKTDHLIGNLQTLEMEKSKIEEQMDSILREREMFLRENHTLSTTTCSLKKRLMEIETKTSMVMSEKERVENQLRVNKQKTEELEQERMCYSKQTRELMNNLKELNIQKEMTEAELKDEVIARIAAEKQLHAAEKALEHMEMALKLSGAHMTELKEQIMPDVHKLKQFFEECAEEAKLDANKPIIMKNAVYARRSIRRSKTRFRASIRRQLSIMKGETKRDSENIDIMNKQPSIVYL